MVGVGGNKISVLYPQSQLSARLKAIEPRYAYPQEDWLYTEKKFTSYNQDREKTADSKISKYSQLLLL